MLNRYRQELIAIREGAQRPPEPNRCRVGRIKCDIPLTEQIEALMRSLPPIQRDRPWTIEDFLIRLKGRYSARPSSGDVGIALRKIGWTRSRDWSEGGAGRRVWMAP